MKVSNWFLQGGKRSNLDVSSKAKILEKKFILKNINSDDSIGTEKKVEFAIQSANKSINQKKCQSKIKRIGI